MYDEQLELVIQHQNMAHSIQESKLVESKGIDIDEEWSADENEDGL